MKLLIAFLLFFIVSCKDTVTVKIDSANISVNCEIKIEEKSIKSASDELLTKYFDPTLDRELWIEAAREKMLKYLEMEKSK